MPLISKVELKKGRNSYCKLYTDHGECFDIDTETYVKYNLKAGVEIENNSLETIKYEGGCKLAIKTAMAYSGYKQRSCGETYDYLIRRGYNEETSNFAVDRLKQLGILNDTKYAHDYVKRTISMKKVSRRKIESDLVKRGIDKETVKQALLLITDEQQVETAAHLIKGYIKKNGSCDLHTMQKISSKLYMKGFEWEVINKAASIIKKD